MFRSVKIIVPNNADFRTVSCQNDYCQSLKVVPKIFKINWLIRCECCGKSIPEKEFDELFKVPKCSEVTYE